MRVSRVKAAETRARVVEVAGRLFRERGLEGIGVDGLMQEAGLTHGGFYRSFASKEDLAAEASTAAMQASAACWTRLIETEGPRALPEIVRSYLSSTHRDAPGAGCAFATLATEAARRDGPLREAFSRGLQGAIGRLARIVRGRNEAARREKAIATFAGLIGTMVLARVADNPAFSEEILAAGRREFGDTGNGNRPGRSSSDHA